MRTIEAKKIIEKIRVQCNKQLLCAISRYFEALRSSKYSDIDSSLQHETFDWFHQHRKLYVACDSWYNASCGNDLEYRNCPGDLLLNWKDKGYCTVLNLLKVSALFKVYANSINL